jgi:HD-GYP domain-containing protein (c-di-GMP phosphodiesterase class II)
MVRFSLAEVANDSSFSHAMYLDESFLLLPAEMPLTRELKLKLAEWDITEVLVAGNEEDVVVFKPGEHAAANVEFDLVPPQSLMNGRSSTQQAMLCQKTFENLCTFTQGVFVRAVNTNSIDQTALTATMGKIVDYVTANRRMVLHVDMSYDGPDSQARQTYHCVCCTIIALLMGLRMEMSKPQLVELGLATQLHELGMFGLAGGLEYKEESYLPKDKREMERHPVLAANLLAAARFPAAVYTGILHHHERENGSGYPHNLIAPDISLYGKIIAVVCTYDALSSDRPYRRRLTPHQAVTQIVQGAGKSFDSRIVQVFLFCISFYPIDTMVLLNDGRMGRVAEINPNAPRKPILQVLNPGADNKKLIVPDGTTLSIERELTADETRKLLRAQKDKE